jgi:hypothetical protein
MNVVLNVSVPTVPIDNLHESLLFPAKSKSDQTIVETPTTRVEQAVAPAALCLELLPIHCRGTRGSGLTLRHCPVASCRGLGIGKAAGAAIQPLVQNGNPSTTGAVVFLGDWNVKCDRGIQRLSRVCVRGLKFSHCQLIEASSS